MSMSLIAASQNHSMSSFARSSSSLKVAMSWRSMNRFSRLLATTSSLGFQITSPMTTGCIDRILGSRSKPAARDSAIQVAEMRVKLRAARERIAETARASSTGAEPADLSHGRRRSAGGFRAATLGFQPSRLGRMEPLPPDFAKQLLHVIEPGDEGAAAEVIGAAIHLDDVRLGKFLELLADRIRSSTELITEDELR